MCEMLGESEFLVEPGNVVGFSGVEENFSEIVMVVVLYFSL